MKLTVFKNDSRGNVTKVKIGEFEASDITLSERRKLKRMLLGSTKDKSFDMDLYSDFLDEVQVISKYPDELLIQYTDVQIDTILLQTYTAWQPAEKKA